MKYFLVEATGLTIVDNRKSAPSPICQKLFSQGFSTYEWSILCENESFIAALETNLSEAKIVAEKILSREKKV